jgi:hypothetical protein
MALNKISRRGIARNVVVDTRALSDRANTFQVRIPVGAFTQNDTIEAYGGALGVPAKLVRADVGWLVKPAGGTLELQIIAYDSSANAAIVLAEDFNPEDAGVVNRESTTITLAATNVALAAEDTLEVHVIASNDAVSAAGTSGVVVLTFRKLDEATAERTDVGEV